MLMVILQIFIFILFTITIVHYIIFTFLCTDIQTFHHHYIYIYLKKKTQISHQRKLSLQLLPLGPCQNFKGSTIYVSDIELKF